MSPKTFDRQIHPRTVTASLILAVAIATSACGGGEEQAEGEATPGVTDGATATGTEESSLSELAAAAEEEGGELDIYFILGAEALQPHIDAFTQQYPFASVEVTGGDPLQLVERAVTEASAGDLNVDLMPGGPLENSIINGEHDLGMDYEAEGMAEVPEEFLFEGPYVVPEYLPFHIAYNSNLLSEEEAPSSLEELTEPEWRGRFAIDIEQIDWFAGELAYYGEEEGMELMERLAANEPQSFASTAGYEQLIAGSPPVIVNAYSLLIEQYRDAGAPLEIVRADHVIAQPAYYVPFADTDSPNTLKLFLEYLFTEEGQTIVAENTGKFPVRNGVPGPYDIDEVCGDDCEIFFETTENFGDFDERVEQFQELFVRG